jgi:GH25 family lysozyme M1 (1,4-beta-N-acetylmuramidase)
VDVRQRGNDRSVLQQMTHRVLLGMATLATCMLAVLPASASDFSEPWKRSDRALVIDAYEYNPIDWQKLSGDKRVVGFINKGSDGQSPPYRCSGNATETKLCKALWKRHAVARELFHTRRTVAKALGLKWGAYHLGRPGNPIDQANNFIDFADPAPDDLIALDIEENDPAKWISLEDAEAFARHIHTRLGRWPVLYTNGSTALYIAENRERYSVLSRLPLWYARYKPQIGLHFPKGYWPTYSLWQFSAGANCDARSCPYRVPGTPLDIDVNVASMSADELRLAWPFGELVEKKAYVAAETVPVPVARSAVLAGGDATIRYATVDAGDARDVAPAVQAPADLAAAPAPAPGQPEEVAEITVETGETVPLPIWRADARKKRSDVKLKFVSVERVVTNTAAAMDIGAMRASPFQALLGKEGAPATSPVVLAGYAQTAAKVRLLQAPAAPPKYVPTGNVSAAALDNPGPFVSVTQLSRKELPVFLLRKLDGPDEPRL